jgi:GT2 family glycosyltransferase
MFKLSISIVSNSDLAALNKCLENIFSNIGSSVSFEVFVTDNANSIGDSIARKYPQVKLIVNGTQKGFSENHNKAIKQSNGEFILIMNPDVYIQKHCVEQMLRVIDEDEKTGVVAPKMLRPDGKTIDSAGHLIFKNRRAADRGMEKADIGQYDVQEEVFSACGAAMLCRRTMLEDTKLFGEYFDETFKLYQEDLDLCWRAHLRGWKVVYVPGAVAYHARGWGRRKKRAAIPRWIRRESFKNRYLTIIKDDHLANFLKDLPFILWHECKALIYVIFKEPHLFIAWFQIITLLPLTLKKRAEIMERSTVGAEEIHKWFV